MKKVTAALIKKGNKILIAKRTASGKEPLKWEFPGGKIEEGETPEECLKREIKEELNIDIVVNEHFGTSIYEYAHGKIELIAYWAEYNALQRIKLTSHSAVKWVSIDELNKFDFAPADVSFIDKLRREHVSL